MKRFLFGLMAIILAATGAGAAFHAPDFNFIHYTTENGLPSNCVRDIVQDEEGFMWFATDAGLVRFDGTSMRVFTSHGDSRSASEFYILSLCTDGRRLIVGTDERLYVYNPAVERMEPLKLTYKDERGKKVEGAVHDIAVDKEHTMWVSVEGKGVFRISRSGEVVACYGFPKEQNFIGDLYVDGKDCVWAVSNAGKGSIYKYDRNNSRFTPFRISVAAGPEDFSALAITSDGDDTFWLGTWENGIIRFNGRTGEGVQLPHLDGGRDAWHIHSLVCLSETQLLAGSDSGLTLVDGATGENYVYREDELNSHSLNSGFVYPVAIDSDGGIWVGTFYRGVNYVSRDSKRFRRWHHSRFANSVSGNVISRISEDQRGIIWIGSADGGLCSFDPSSSVFRHYPLGESQSNDNVNAICPDGDRLWVGTYTKGAGYVDMSTGRWHRVPVEGETGSSCYAICKDSRGNIWMAATQTLTRYDAGLDVFVKVRPLNAWICDIDEDRDGSLWISTQGGGVYHFNPVTGKWRRYGAGNGEWNLPHNHISSLKIDSGGDVYAATVYGVYVYDREKDGFRKLEGSYAGYAVSSVEKTGDEFWVATASGLINLRGDGTRHIYRSADGLADDQFSPGASFHASDGKIYYGTVHGFCMVDPAGTRGKEMPPVVRFTGLDIVNTPVAVGDPRLPESLNDINTLVLSHADHTVSIYFSALNYSNPGSTGYAYRLEGFDKAWIDAGKENRATYSNLPPGSYTLRVRACNGDGVWTDDGITLKIVVKPAWYASAIMKALYVIAGMALLLLAVRYVLWRMKRDHIKELDRISSNKEKEMFRSKLSFFTVVAHEIRTPVSLIIGPLEKVMEDQDKFTPAIKEDLNIINRNARRLLSLVNQLLDFKKVEDNALPTGFRHEKIIPLVEGVADRFRPSVEHDRGRLIVDFPDRELEGDIDPEALTKLVSNLLNNARKFTRDEISISCAPSPDGKSFTIRVADNGIGISRENRDKVFKPFFQVIDNINESKGGTGLGLAIVKSVVEAHGGSIELESTPGKGATFIVTLPLHQDKVMPVEAVAAADIEEARVDSPVSPGGENVRPVLLVVDDNEEMVRFISSNFEKQYDVVTAANGKEALARMGERQVALIICDWMMPVMDGVEFLKTVRGDENYSHIPFVMLTAKTDNTSKIETMRCGADAYVEKPFSIGFLEARIDNLLKMRKMLRDKYSHSPLEPISTLAPTQVDNELLTRLQKVIEENFSNPSLSVDFLAEHLGISRSGLYAKIRTLADVTPNELIQITRLKKAAEYLSEGHYRINEICYMVGFNSSSYFSRCFQKQFGVKPGEFAGK